MTTINLTFDDRPVLNYGQGFQTTQRVSAPTDFVQSKSAYWKFYASELVRADGSYNFVPVFTALDKCKAASQRMVTRIALIDPDVQGFDIPAVWKTKMKTVQFTSTDTMPANSRTFSFPDMSDPAAVAELTKFLTAFYSNCASHVAFNGIDVFWHGLWGEAHFSGCTKTGGTGTLMPTLAVRKQFIDLLFNLVPFDIDKFACLDDSEAAAYAISKGASWRQDGVGNPAHMQKLIPEWIQKTAAQKTWCLRKVTAEIYSNLSSTTWANPAPIFDELGRLGVSLLHAKTVNPPLNQQAACVNFLRTCGFNPFISKAVFPDEIHAGEKFRLYLTIQNVGTTPNYKPMSVLMSGSIEAYAIDQLYPGQRTTIGFDIAANAEGPVQIATMLACDFEIWHPKNASFDAATGSTLIGTVQVLPAIPAPAEDAKTLWKKLHEALAYED